MGRVPPAGELLHGRHIDVAVVEPGFDLGKVTREESAVLVDGVPSEGCLALFGVFAEKVEDRGRHLDFVDGGLAYARCETRLAVVARVPFVHGGKHFGGLVNDQIRALSGYVEVAIGDEDRDLQDSLTLGIEPGHF